ncbi:LamG domain-containing protein [Candidatus Poribacteria bacterium]
MLTKLLSGIMLAIFCMIPLISGAQDIEDALVLYLPINEGNGDEVKDLGPFGFETEMSEPPPQWVKVNDNPLLSTALEFDGTGNFVKIDMAGQGHDLDSHIDEEKGVSICAWVKVLEVGTDAAAQTRQPAVMKGNSGAWEFALYVHDDFGAGMSVWDCGGTGVSEPSAAGKLPRGEWHYVCGTFNAADGVAVYVDADKNPVVQQAPNANVPCDGNRPVFLAHREDGQWLNAVIAEVRIWERVIDAEEIELAMKSIGGLSVHPAGSLTTAWGKIKVQ